MQNILKASIRCLPPSVVPAKLCSTGVTYFIYCIVRDVSYFSLLLNLTNVSACHLAGHHQGK